MTPNDFPTADDLIAHVRDLGKMVGVATACQDQLQAEHDQAVAALRLLVIATALTTIVVLLHTYRIHKLWGTVADSC